MKRFEAADDRLGRRRLHVALIALVVAMPLKPIDGYQKEAAKPKPHGHVLPTHRSEAIEEDREAARKAGERTKGALEDPKETPTDRVSKNVVGRGPAKPPMLELR